MIVKPKKYKDKTLKTVRTITVKEIDDKIKQARDIGVQIGGLTICKVISGILASAKDDADKLYKISKFIDKTIDSKGKNL